MSIQYNNIKIIFVLGHALFSCLKKYTKLYSKDMNLALYRKYRPKLLRDLLGQAMAVEILQNAAKQNRLAHAYLFYGPRGSGKTTTARLIAKIANCEKRAADAKFRMEGEPCNDCRTCKEIDEGRGLDVIEIDAASNRGIDEIRNLQEGVRLSPVRYPYKIFIIDEVHMLTTPAFNALLKTLEEPPAHAIFILATTEYEKIPATILSRVQRFQLTRVAKNIIEEKLKIICAQEKIKADEKALEVIAISAEGSVRDAESLLDQLSQSYGEITVSDAEKTIGRTGTRRLHELTAHILKKDLPAVLSYINKLDSAGVNMAQFNKDLIHYLRRVLSLKLNPSIEALFENDFTKDEISAIKGLGIAGDTSFFIALIKSLIRAYGEMRYSPFASVPLEIAIIENIENLGVPAKH